MLGNRLKAGIFTVMVLILLGLVWVMFWYIPEVWVKGIILFFCSFNIFLFIFSVFVALLDSLESR